MLLRPAQRTYRHWIIDSTRWDHFPTRPGDIVIATYPKCGTTWMQRIVNLLVHQESYWAQRTQANVLLVHYNDLQADLHTEMRRIADFLEISLPPSRLPELADAASFESMRRDGDQLLSAHAGMFKGGNDRFFFRAQNQRWRGVIDAQDLALYDAKVKEKFSPACTAWVAHGRLVAGEPRSAPD